MITCVLNFVLLPSRCNLRKSYDIEHRRTPVKRPQTNGFVERFIRTAKEEFFTLAFRRKLYTSLETLQADFDARLHAYNTERPHLGYRNMGRCPLETVMQRSILSV